MLNVEDLELILQGNQIINIIAFLLSSISDILPQIKKNNSVINNDTHTYIPVYVF